MGQWSNYTLWHMSGNALSVFWESFFISKVDPQENPRISLLPLDAFMLRMELQQLCLNQPGKETHGKIEWYGEMERPASLMIPLSYQSELSLCYERE